MGPILTLWDPYLITVPKSLLPSKEAYSRFQEFGCEHLWRVIIISLYIHQPVWKMFRSRKFEGKCEKWGLSMNTSKSSISRGEVSLRLQPLYGIVFMAE